MKKFLLFCAILSLLSSHLNAQFIDDMEWPPANCPSHWLNNATCPLITTSNAHSGVQSGLIPDDMSTDNVLDLGNRTTGEWGLEFWLFVPEGREAYFNLQGVVPVTSGEWIVGDFYFNPGGTSPGIGTINDTALGLVDFSFPYDE